VGDPSPKWFWPNSLDTLDTLDLTNKISGFLCPACALHAGHAGQNDLFGGVSIAKEAIEIPFANLHDRLLADLTIGLRVVPAA
jgi:hypothetical protein